MAKSKVLTHNIAIVGGSSYRKGDEVTGEDLAKCEKAGAHFVEVVKSAH